MTDEIRQHIKEAVRQVDYDKIVLFGSRARGDFSKASDYDLLIIVRHPLDMREKIRMSTHIRKLLAKRGIDADVIIKSPEEIQYYRDKIGNVVRTALEEGVVLE